MSDGQRLLAAFLRQNFRKIRDNLIDLLPLQLAFFEGVVSLHFLVDVQQDRHVGVLGNLVARRTGGIVDRESGVLDLFFVGQLLQLLVQTFLIAEEDRKAAHARAAVLGGGGVDLFDQTGHRFADLAREDHCDRTVAVRSDQALLGAGELARYILRIKRRAPLADLRPRLEGLRGDQAAGEQHDRQGSPYGDAVLHRKTYLLVKDADSELPPWASS